MYSDEQTYRIFRLDDATPCTTITARSMTTDSFMWATVARQAVERGVITEPGQYFMRGDSDNMGVVFTVEQSGLRVVE